jgi:hypothetical protein
MVHDAHDVRVETRELVEDLRGGVATPIVDDDDLVIRRERLAT